MALCPQKQIAPADVASVASVFPVPACVGAAAFLRVVAIFATAAAAVAAVPAETGLVVVAAAVAGEVVGVGHVPTIPWLRILQRHQTCEQGPEALEAAAIPEAAGAAAATSAPVVAALGAASPALDEVVFRYRLAASAAAVCAVAASAAAAESCVDGPLHLSAARAASGSTRQYR